MKDSRIGMRVAVFAAALALASTTAQSAVTLNLKDADINTLIATVSEVTGKNFIVDTRVKGKVTVISSSPMTADSVYQTFLAVLEVNGFAAIPSGSAIKIIPDTNARTDGSGAASSGAGMPADGCRHPRLPDPEHLGGAAGADPAAAGATVGPPRRLRALEHADHLGSRRQRAATRTDHPRNGSDRRPRAWSWSNCSTLPPAKSCASSPR